MARLTEYRGEPMIPALAIEELFQNKDFLFIRGWLREHDMDPHMRLELNSTEIALITPWGVMLEVRTADNGKLGLCGGVVRRNETTLECAVREIREELGIKVKADSLKFVEDNIHAHTYANGDKALFHCYRFVCMLSDIPDELEFDSESTGVEIVRNLRDDILPAQQDFVSRCIQQYVQG